ncbi:MAG: polysaccharide deacetylase family protein [Firmicutes bacterium]|nr:polysaccharide deacetylase family protein [Bacillota bacterium]
MWPWAVLAAAGVGYTVGAQVAARAGFAVRRGPGRSQVALTFDDGPHPEYTLRILDVLARYRVRATFFFVGRYALELPDVAREVARAGHSLGSHTFSHGHLWTLGPRATWREVAEGVRAVQQATGVRPIYFRPPWGAFNLAALAACRRLGLVAVLWTVRGEGYRWKPTAEQMAREVVRRAHPGAVVNLHDRGGFPDTPQRVLEALPRMVEGLRSRGLEPVSLDELLRAGHGARPAGRPVQLE